MFHTVELFRKVDSSEYYYLFKSLLKLSKEKETRYFKDGVNKMVFNCFTEKGITIVMCKYKLSDYRYYEIRIRFAPKKLLKEKEFIEVVNEEDMKFIKQKFSEAMSELKDEFNDVSNEKLIFVFHNLENYFVRRIDYCMNIYSKNCVEIMKLIKRGDIPKNFKPYLKYDNKQKER